MNTLASSDRPEHDKLGPDIDPSIALGKLLPLRAVVVTLRFEKPSSPRFFHQAALSAFLRHLANPFPDYDHYIRIDACESGRIKYKPGDMYRFLLIALGGGESLLQHLIEQLHRLPASAPSNDQSVPFRANVRLHALQDAFSEAPVSNAHELSAYGSRTLDEECRLWQERNHFTLRWLSPARVLRDKKVREKERAKGESRYCRDSTDLTSTHLLGKLHDSLADLLRRRGERSVSRRPQPPDLVVTAANLFWADNHYVDGSGRRHQMGGMTGELGMQSEHRISDAWWQLLVLGQYTGMGQRTAFGWGRYLLLTPAEETTYRRPLPAASILTSANSDENLSSAWRHVLAKNDVSDERIPVNESEAADAERASTDLPLAQLHHELEQLQQLVYEVPRLRGFVIPKSNGGVRPLAIPPFRDRVLQRSVAQVLSPALEQLMYERSYGYRAGRSRISASYDIQSAWRAGYRWVYESDIQDFFDSVDLGRLKVRLRALFGEDPAVYCILNWMAAEVHYEGETVRRKNGLPQGSPLSPLMANLMLDDFDSDMREAGFRLVRFADDFIVLCKNPDEARAAGEAARESLAEHGLSLNPDKTRVTAMRDGFRYLGYLFVNDMVLDVGGKERKSRAKASVPPNSWLAQLGEREPERSGKTTISMI